MAKKYKFMGAKFTDPVITIQDFSHSFDSGETRVNCHISDKDDSISIELVSMIEPNNYRVEGLEKWVRGIIDEKHNDSK